MRNTKKGFTLVELLVVIAILAVLATVSVVGYTSFIDRANQSTALQEMTQIRDSVIAEDILNPNFSISGGTITVADGTDPSYPNFNEYVKSLTDALGEGRSCDNLETGEAALVLKNTDKKVKATWTFADNTIETDKLGNDEPVAPPAGGGDEGGAAACEHEWVDATCVAPKTCGKCGETEGEPNPDAHDMVADPESFVAATCTTDGSEAGTKCSRCTHKVAGAVIPAAHSFAAEWTSDSAQHWHACSIAGCTGKTDIADHTWVNGECSVCHKALPETATISFADKANRTEFDGDHQIWKQNLITVTNNQGSSTSAVADYANPARFYQNSQLIVEYPSMRTVIFNCGEGQGYLENALEGIEGATVVVSGSKVTVTFGEKVDKIDVILTSGQVRLYDIEISTLEPATPEIPAEPTLLATFELGANGSASHSDGSSKTEYTETVDGYTLNIINGTNMYTGARDAKGNSCLKLGTGSKAGSFSFTVPENVTEVVIYVAKYKANNATVKVNEAATTLTKASNDGQYDVITIDTTTTKTVSFTVSSGYRCMVNTIVFNGTAN